MSLTGSLDFASNLAAQAQRDADAVERLVAGLTALQGLGGGGFDESAAAAGRLALETEKAANQLAAIAAKADATSQGTAEASAAKLAAIASKGEQDRVTNAEKAAADLASAKAREDANLEAIGQKSAAALLAIEEQKQARLDVLAAKAEQAQTARAERQAEQAQKIADKAASEETKKRAEFAKSTSDNTDAQANDDQQATADAAEAVAKVVAAIVEKIAKVTLDLLEAGAQLSETNGAFRETSEAAFGSLLGSGEAASRMYDKLTELEATTGQKKELLERKLVKELTAGASEQEALAAIKAAAIVSTVVGQAAGDKLATILTKVDASDKFGTRNLAQLNAVGIKTQDIYDGLAAKLGKTNAEVVALVKAGKVSAEAGNAVIEELVGKKFGGAMDAAANTLPRLIDRIKTSFADLFDDPHVADGARGPLAAIAKMLEGPGAAKLKGALSSLFGNLFSMFGEMFDGAKAGEIFDDIAAGIARVGAFIKDITPGVSGFVKGFVEGFAKFLPVIGAAASAFLSLMGAVGGMGSFWTKAGEGLGFFIGLLALIVEIVVEIVGVIVALFATVGGAVAAVLGLWSDLLTGIKNLIVEAYDAVTGGNDEAASAAQDAGGNIMDGMAAGVRARASAVADAVVAAAGDAIAAAKRILGIASPSKVFHGIGAWGAEGMADGFDSGAGDVAQAARDMAHDAAQASAAVGTMGPVLGLAGGGTSGASNSNAAGAKGAGPIFQFAAGAVVIHASTEAGGAAAARGFYQELQQLAESA